MDKLLERFMLSEINVATPEKSHKNDLVTRILVVRNLLEGELTYVRSDLCRLYLSSMDIFRMIQLQLNPYFMNECEVIINYTGDQEPPQEIITQILRYLSIERRMNQMHSRRELPCSSSYCMSLGSQVMKDYLQRQYKYLFL